MARCGESPRTNAAKDPGPPYVCVGMRRSLSLALLVGALAVPLPASAESWGASPLHAHEWGVQAFSADGAPLAPALSNHFHRAPSTHPPSHTPPVRSLPPDTGERALPLLHFYSGGTLTSGPIPVAVEVGFTEGDALAWYPQVDERRPAATANGAAARLAREALLRRRAALQPHATARTGLDGDPTAQLVWNALSLTPEPQHRPTRADAAWVDRFRDFGALWVNGARESERFVFYEAVTHERVALELTRGDRYRPDHRHFVLRNRGAHAVHDVFVTHRERDRVFVFFAPSIPAGRSAGFVLEAHAVTDVLPWSAGSAADFIAATRARLRERLVDADSPTPPTSMQWSRDDCVMMRDPAIPTTTAEGHRLYAHEVDAILDVWASTFFGSPGTTIVYREDPAYLDRAMPLSIYTDMYNHVKLRRLGLAVWRL